MILAALALSLTSGPSFDCSRATNQVEGAICADPDLAMRDRALALLYRPVQDAFEGRMRLQQRDWLENRNSCRTTVCIRELYDRRLAQLAKISIFSNPLQQEDYVGSLQIAPVGGEWYFFSAITAGGDSIEEVVIASAVGFIRLQNGSGRWRSDLECTLNLRQMPHQRWEVTENKACRKTFSGLSLSGIYMTEQDWLTPDHER